MTVSGKPPRQKQVRCMASIGQSSLINNAILAHGITNASIQTRLTLKQPTKGTDKQHRLPPMTTHILANGNLP